MTLLPKSKPLRWIAIAVLAVGLFALLGFQVAPRVVRSQAVAFVKEKYGRDLAIGEVRINPFLLQVEIRDFGLPDADGGPMIGFRRLFVDFELSSIWHRAYVFRDVTIEAPELRAVVRPDQRLNLLDLAPEPSPEPEPSEPPRLWLKSFVVDGGTIGFTDLARAQPFQRQFTPVTFALKDFRTTAEGGGFDLSARTPNAELFEIKGAIEVTPRVASRGSFAFKGLHLPGVAEYLGDALPFGLTSGTAELGGDYDVELGEELAARLKIPRIAVTDLALRARGADADWVKIPSVEVADTALALVKRTASVGNVKVQGLDVQAWMAADGSINLLGRGSVCINTGGEKVFPEEVEEALKEHPAVYDAVVVGVPDEKFGEAIMAIVEPIPGVTAVESDLIEHVRAHLAAYKAPKRVITVDSIGRAPNAKVDYARWKTYAATA